MTERPQETEQMLAWNRMLCGAMFAFVLASTQVVLAVDDTAVSLIVTPKVGRVLRLKSVLKLNLSGMGVVVNEIQKNTIKEVKANGDVVSETTVESSVSEIDGQEMDQPIGDPYTSVVDKFGKLKELHRTEVSNALAPEISQIMEALGSFVFTEKAVKPNDTWQTYLENPAMKEKKILVKSVYLGLDKIDGKEYWKLRQTAEAVVDTDGSKINGETTIWVTPVTGELLRIDSKFKNVPSQFGPMSLEINSKAIK